jgi:hypothetical protein
MTIVQAVERWYEANLDRLRPMWRDISIRSYKAADPVHGKVEIRAESDLIAASVTFWNKGDVDAERLDMPEKRISVIDDRRLSPSENVGLLLDSYFQQLGVRSE